jgi:hypothetical protein
MSIYVQLHHQQNITNLCITKIRRVTCFNNTALTPCGARKVPVNTACQPERLTDLFILIASTISYRPPLLILCIIIYSLPHRSHICKIRHPSISVMLREVAESGLSKSRGQEALIDSSAHIADLWTSAKNPPPYGAQHHQDALWEGEQSRRSDTHRLIHREQVGMKCCLLDGISIRLQMEKHDIKMTLS